MKVNIEVQGSQGKGHTSNGLRAGQGEQGAYEKESDTSEEDEDHFFCGLGVCLTEYGYKKMNARAVDWGQLEVLKEGQERAKGGPRS